MKLLNFILFLSFVGNNAFCFWVLIPTNYLGCNVQPYLNNWYNNISQFVWNAHLSLIKMRIKLYILIFTSIQFRVFQSLSIPLKPFIFFQQCKSHWNSNVEIDADVDTPTKPLPPVHSKIKNDIKLINPSTTD